MPKYTFHLLANAHLDPVWLWDWREGLNEGITTCRTMLDLMDERPEMTFIRGEAAIYQHIEKNEPKTFTRIKDYVKKGRWDVVGGTYIQPDTNLPATEIFARHFAYAKNYFMSRFNEAPRIAWAADSFGHSAGLPEILSKAGMTGFAFTRPESHIVALENPSFWWEGSSGARVLAYRPLFGAYLHEREEMNARLDAFLHAADTSKMRNIGIYVGLGNHGGGPTRRNLDEIAKWTARHPEVAVIHSGLHRFFQALADEEKIFPGGKFPVHRGEINFCLRGCYSAMAKFKFPYRRAEAELTRAEATDSLIAARLGRKPADLATAWKSVLFNSFHDILPGTSVERAYDDQLSWLGVARHEAQSAEFDALNALGREVDTSVPKPWGKDEPSRVPFLVWNPHPYEYEGPVELEGSLDYRPVWEYLNRADDLPFELIGPDGRKVPFQALRTEHSCFPQLAWRKRLVFRAKLPPLGWSVFQLGKAQKASTSPVSEIIKRKSNTIESGPFRIEARKGSETLQIFLRGKPWFKGPGFSVAKFADEWGSWGGMAEEPESFIFTKPQERWKITAVELLEDGPERSALWVRFAGAMSRLDLTFLLAREHPAVEVHARVLWNERCSRLKMTFPVGDQARFDVTGGMADRGPCGEVPGGRWVQVGSRFGFASDALYDFDLADGCFRTTVVRASRYANDVKTAPQQDIWRPAVDAGELKFRFLLTAKTALLPRLAKELEQPVVAQSVPPQKGTLPRSGSLFSLEPKNVQLLAIKPAEKGPGWIVRLQECAGAATRVNGRWLGKKVSFGKVNPWTVNSFRVTPQRKGWSVVSTNIVESK